MVNVNIQSMIPLQGRGHTYRKNGGYTSGEYKALINVELNDLGHIVSRRNITLCNRTSVITTLTNPREFIGHVADGAMVVGLNEMKVLHHGPVGSTEIDCWNPASIGDTAPNYNYIKKFIRYNKFNHWITSFYNGSNYGFKVYRVSASSEYGPYTTVPSLVATVQESAASTFYPDMAFKNAFVHKERLWVALGGALYFSKPTDFSDFSVPNGGFFKFSESNINYAIALRDSVYVVCDSAVYIITYSADPNLDAYVTKIDEAKGGDSACVYQGNVYYTKDDSLNVITNNNISKVMDLNLGFWGERDNYSRLVPFGDYLVLQRFTKESYNSSGIPIQGESAHPVSLASYTDNQPSLYFINMGLGSIHAVDFSDNQPSADPGYIADVFLVPREDANNNLYLYLLTKRGFGTSRTGNCYTMPITKPNDYYDGTNDIPAVDYIRDVSGNVKRVNHRVKIEIDSFVPDGTEYAMKKFRNLMISAKFPFGASGGVNEQLKLKLAYDNRDYSTGIELKDEFVSNSIGFAKPPAPHRYPLNQRGHALSILMELEPSYTSDTSVLQDMLIEDIRLFWTYTQRMTTKRDQTASADTI